MNILFFLTPKSDVAYVEEDDSLRQVLEKMEHHGYCLLYTSDAADDLLCVDLGGRRILKKKNHLPQPQPFTH